MKKNKTRLMLIFMSLFICNNIYAQTELDSTKIKKTLFNQKITSYFNIEGAKKDIKKKNIRILFSGGFGEMPNFDNKKDIEFQKKYFVEFLSQGCIKMGEDENVEAYNKTIFVYLDNKYGEKWRADIRKDAIGIK